MDIGFKVAPGLRLFADLRLAVKVQVETFLELHSVQSYLTAAHTVAKGLTSLQKSQDVFQGQDVSIIVKIPSRLKFES